MNPVYGGDVCVYSGYGGGVCAIPVSGGGVYVNPVYGGAMAWFRRVFCVQVVLRDVQAHREKRYQPTALPGCRL